MAERMIPLPDGVVMAVTDLHGAWDAYVGLRDKFLRLYQAGEANTLLFCGDLIHGDGTETYDASLEIMLDVMRLQREYGRDHVLMLLGNHEMPHIYGLTLSRGEMVYTPPFEAALVELDRKAESELRRADVIQFFMDAPFYAVTSAGVMFSHAGTSRDLRSPHMVSKILATDHQALIDAADEDIKKFGFDAARSNFERILGQDYDEQVKRLLSVSGRDDPRYYDLLRSMVISNGNPDFDLLWSALFSRNEHEVGLMEYKATVTDFLAAISAMVSHEQRVLVAGHIAVKGGYELVGKQQLRLASHAHAHPRKQGCYLLLDAATPVNSAEDLVPMLHLTAEVM